MLFFLVFDYALANKGRVVLAASCSAGKTRMSIEIIRKFIKTNSEAKVLVLTHGRTILRSQYCKTLNEVKFKNFSPIMNIGDAKDFSGQVALAIPQTLRSFPSEFFRQFDLVVIDEAHHFYQAETETQILKKCGSHYELLLSASPSGFIKSNKSAHNESQKIPIVSNSMIDLYHFGIVASPKIELLHADYNYRESDLNVSLNLKKNVVLQKHKTNSTLEKLVKSLIEKLKTNEKSTNQKQLKNPSIGKTLIAAHSQSQARDIAQFFEKRKIQCAVSISSLDKDSQKIDRFVEDPNLLVLVVVNRGVLGFNFPPLETVVDMTGSLKPDRVFQLMSRVVRKHGKTEKNFIKIMPTEAHELSILHMSFVVAMIMPEVYETYDGDYRKMRIPIHPAFKLHKKDMDRNKNEMPFDLFQPLKRSALPSFEIMESIYKSKKSNQGNFFSHYSWTTIEAVKAKWSGKWNKELCIEDAKRFKKRVKWREKNPHAYMTARQKGWIDECCLHMEPAYQELTFEECRDSALKHDSRKSWFHSHKKAYTQAKRKGWLRDCCTHMAQKAKQANLSECIEDARRYRTVAAHGRNSVVITISEQKEKIG